MNYEETLRKYEEFLNEEKPPTVVNGRELKRQATPGEFFAIKRMIKMMKEGRL